MWRLLAGRLGTLPLVLLGISVVVFLVLPIALSDPAAARQKYADAAERRRFLERTHLDQPLPSQYLLFVRDLVTGDLGESWVTDRALSEDLGAKVAATVELAVSAMFVAVFLGVLLGIVAASTRGRPPDLAVMIVALLGVSIPVFCLGIFAQRGLAVDLGWFPTSGRLSPALEGRVPAVTQFIAVDALLAGDFRVLVDALRHLVLPALCLGAIPTAVIARITRASMIDTLGQDYVRTARAKGVPPRGVVLRHALRNALLPVLTIIGTQFGYLLGGAVLTETVFAWPGLGRFVVTAIEYNDYQKIRVGVLMLTVSYVLVNLAVDVLYIVVNPRLRKA